MSVKGHAGENNFKQQRELSIHERTIKIFERASSQSKDSEVKAFADKQLPILKKHLEHARMMDEKR